MSATPSPARCELARRSQEQEAPLLRELAAAIDPALKPLAEAIDRAVEQDGSDLKDNASPKLRKLRGELRTGRQRVADRLEQLVRKSGIREHLQEDFVTQRGGRPVLAVKVSSRSSVPGIVHDASDSGQTLFVEPFEIAELSNRQAEAAGAEREEAERILRELSAAVGEQAEPLELAVEASGQIDLAIALGTISRGWRGAAVEVSDEVRLVGARHPLLDAKTAVPIDLDLGSLRALVISGPNTGGKTVALKTLGLAALLHQAGLRPPAETAALPVFDQVLADIGDRQSIEMSLSTFSGHVANLVEILHAARERSLVLLDEVAAGTDPVEGSALAQALLARLAEQARLTVVTTHYAELKEWASATEGVANAATGFDPDTHAPLYRIALGRPGISHALQTAERLGLDAEVVADARGRVAPERLRIEELLAEAEAAERTAVEEREAAAVERARGRRAARLGPSARGGAGGRDRGGPRVGRGRARARCRRSVARACDRARGARGAARRDQDGSAQAARRAGTGPQARRGVGAGRASGARDQVARRAAAADRAARSRRPRGGTGARRPRNDRRDRGRRGGGGRAGGPPASRPARTAASVAAARSRRPRRRSRSSPPRAAT